MSIPALKTPSLAVAALMLLLVNHVDSFSSLPRRSLVLQKTTRSHHHQRTSPLFASEVETVSPPTDDSLQKQERRVLGSQENLMLPRQYGPNPDVKFPPMNHVMVAKLSATPSEAALRGALEEVLETHPLLRAQVEGDGEPDERIDLMNMVRKGEPNPLTYCAPKDKSPFNSQDVLSIINVANEDSLETGWKNAFGEYLDSPDWCNAEQGPLWKVELYRIENKEDAPCALVFHYNHAISDQSTANLVLDQIVKNVADIESSGKISTPAVKQAMPVALEDSVLGLNHRFSDVQTEDVSFDTVKYVAGKAAEGFKSPVILSDDLQEKKANPLLGALTIISGKAAGGVEEDQERKSTLQFRTLPEETTSALLKACRANGVTMTNALAAAVTLTATDFIDGGEEKQGKSRNYKVLQSFDMRRFGAKLDKCETMACMAGSMDLMFGPLADRSGYHWQSARSKEERFQEFWALAREGKKQTEEFVQSGGPEQAVRVFDAAMTISDMNNLVYLTAQSKDTQGRAYSAGITNVGVYERQAGVRREGQTEREKIKVKHGNYEVKDIFFATTHARSGCLYLASCMSVGGELKCTFHPASPLVSEETNAEFADSFIELLETISSDTSASSDPAKIISENVLPLATAAVGVAAIASHAGAYSQFYESVMQMKEAADPQDFWAALNFWIFFAGTHPLLPPVLWISDVLHGSPGPMIGDLVPISFILGNLAVIGAYTLSKQIRNSINIAAFAAYFAYIGAGLDGQAGLGDFNLALDDSYKGQVVRGCPTYDEVRQPSMNNFDLKKYQGKWYEHKFHDWTQFKEVYDTSLDIKLTEDGTGWIDDFAVRGPDPKAAPLSWDKSPVAEGAHYFLFGRVDPKDPPGVLRESGFGVEFPNYIVDVKKDAGTGEYKEAIQFQCLERGGVRVFEGINFMSRNEEMSDEELAAMHSRAEQAGMYPYGASPEQMHRVNHRPEGAPPLENSWQSMWHAIGFDKLLELLAESIEDGGR